MLETSRVRRQWRKLYRSAVRAGLTDLGVRLRNETARTLKPSETIVEDEPVLISDAQGLLTEKGTGRGRWAWMVVTSERAVWAALPDKERLEASLADLDLVFSEGDLDTFRWNQDETKRRKTTSKTISVTIGFLKKSEIRELLHASVRDARYDPKAADRRPREKAPDSEAER